MNVSDVIAFLMGEIPGNELQRIIADESARWGERLSERGRSAPISLSGTFENFDVTPERAAVLLDAYISGELSSVSFAYVLDAMLIENRFRWTSVSARDALEHVLGSEYPRKMDLRRAWQARTELKGL